jgi:lysophospholipase L1-like esterase
MKALLIVGLVLIATLRAAWCGETNHNFAKWEKEISAFERVDATTPPPKGAFLFIGSSTIRLWKTLQQDFPTVKVINRGFGGSEIVDSTHFAQRIIFPYEPSRIFFRAGGNDLAAGKSAEEVFGDFKDFVAKVRGKLPKTEILFIGWNPTIARWSQVEKEKALNALVKEYVEHNEGLKYIDTYSLPLGADGKPRAELFMPDKLHFNAEGYKLLAEKVRPFVQK